MPFWLCEQRRDQQSDHIQRFDPRFWTVNFPRPMMASVVTTAPDALRVETVFYDRDALAGLIWDSVDTFDHPLLAYATDRDYAHTTLSFRWRSHGVKPLDAVHGPTLTIEGRDASGDQRSWYVRLWNYATGTPDDAQISLAFSSLSGGFLLPGEADPVHPFDIDRMFISLVPPSYDGTAGPLAEAAAGWVELTDIRCDGARAMLPIGDVLVPPHGLAMATAYDDSFNQTPARLIRNVIGLGYRGSLNHYVGMSHYFALDRVGDALLVSDAAMAINPPCAAWHRSLAEHAAIWGLSPIVSLSYELFDAHCPAAWKQRADNGDPALTGWVPPSTLLSPANGDAMAYLRSVGIAFAEILEQAGLPVRFQIGEPWWWIMPDGRICLYDDAALAAFGPVAVPIPTIRSAMNAAQQVMLDQAGVLLAQSTAALAHAVRDALAPAPVETLLLVYLPTVLDDAAPDARRANVPTGWAWPAFDVLQLEDYDWVIEQRFATQKTGLQVMQQRLGYPLGQQHYMSGFVLLPEDRAVWAAIAQAVDAGKARGVAESLIWALPQVVRDGFVYFDFDAEGDAAMQAFDDVLFPLAIGREAQTSRAFSTQIFQAASGHETRNSLWADCAIRFDVGPGVRSEADVATLVAFFRARRGPARGFRLRDPADHSSAGTGPPAASDQL
uniref:non-contractile tail sheath protein n=1 Tax=Blastomonas sp. TaxID=1909299 RepID=UPI00359458EB